MLFFYIESTRIYKICDRNTQIKLMAEPRVSFGSVRSSDVRTGARITRIAVSGRNDNDLNVHDGTKMT